MLCLENSCEADVSVKRSGHNRRKLAYLLRANEATVDPMILQYRKVTPSLTGTSGRGAVHSDCRTGRTRLYRNSNKGREGFAENILSEMPQSPPRREGVCEARDVNQDSGQARR